MSDTWEFDGVDWRQVTPATSPPARYYGGLAYDSNRDVMVLFGGTTNASEYNDTWEFDGSDWTQVTPAVSPGGCSRLSMAYDPVRQVVVVRGQRDEPGDGLCSMAQQTWEYDGSTWTQVLTSSQPADGEHSDWHSPLVWDEQSGRLLYFLDNEVWTYDGIDWSLVESFDCGIEGAGIDDGRGVSVFVQLIDPDNPRSFGTTWEWSGSATCPESVTHTQNPPSRTLYNAPLIYFAARGSLLMYGGFDYCTSNNHTDTWEYLLDSDGDGFADSVDCDDSDSLVYPGAPELCDGKNNDCDDVSWPGLPSTELDGDGDGLSFCEGDCNDANQATSPSAPESCDGYDNDCDTLIDPPPCDGICDSPEQQGNSSEVASTLNTTWASAIWTGTQIAAVWSDRIVGVPRLRFKSFAPDGTTSADSLIVEGASGSFTVPAMAWSGSEFGVVYQHAHGTSDTIFLRVDEFGNQVGSAVTIGFGQGSHPSIVWNGGEFAVVWTENATTMYFARLDRNGVVTGQPLVVVDGDLGDIVNAQAPALAWNGSGYGIVWGDDRTPPGGNEDIYFARLDALGNKIGGDVLIAPTSPAVDTRPALAWTGDSYGLTWHRGGDPGIRGVHFIRLDADGSALSSSVRLSAVSTPVPDLSWTGSEFVVFWHEDSLVRMARVDSTGSQVGQQLDTTFPSHTAPTRTNALWLGEDLSVVWSHPTATGGIVRYGNVACGCVDGDLDGVTTCGDCDDSDPDTYPGAPELCDGKSNDCSDPEWPVVPGDELDGDSDLFAPCAGDCDDSSSVVFPGAANLCDGINNDCNDPLWPTLTGNESDDDGDTLSECQGDCDDTAGSVYPGALQLCDGLNNDCTDPTWPTVPADEIDVDGDFLAPCEGDCDDSADDVYPGAPQLCDGANNDCDDPDWPLLPSPEVDDDSDLFSECQGDCNDSDAAVNPNANEICNETDDDCDGLTDEDELGEDTDGDGVHNLCDNCRDLINPSQADTDDDTVGNSCDNCLFDPNLDQADFDLDQRGDICDNCPTEFNSFQDDFDSDGFGDVCDNCPFDAYPSQSDTDSDFEGDWCDFDDGLIYLFFIDPAYVEWQQETGFDAWNSYRGDLTVLRAGGNYTQDPLMVPLADQQCGLADPWDEEFDVLPPGTALFYLTTGLSGSVENELGDSSVISPRPNDNPCP